MQLVFNRHSINEEEKSFSTNKAGTTGEPCGENDP